MYVDDLIRQKYPSTIADDMPSVKPMQYNSSVLKLKPYKIGILKKIMCLLGIHKYDLVHTWGFGFSLRCKCGKEKAI